MGLEFTGDMIDDIIGYIGSIFSDMSNLVLLIVGVSLGLIVIGAIISIIKR
jgi:hypothetical protein